MQSPVLKVLRLAAFGLILTAMILGQAPSGVSQAARSNINVASAGASSSAALSSSAVPASVAAQAVSYLPIINFDRAPGPKAQPGIDPALVQQLKQSARGQASVQVKDATGRASFVSVAKGGDLLPAVQGQTPQGKALGFFNRFGGLFGIANPVTDLSQIGQFTDAQGATHITYQQSYRGIPVFAGILRAHVDSAGQLTAVNGAFVPSIDLETTPSLSAQSAADAALAEVLANPPTNEETDSTMAVSASELKTGSPTLYVYNDGLAQNVPGTNHLAYEVEVANGSSIRELVYVDAQDGSIVNRISLVEDALFRRLFEVSTSTQVWQEGDPFPGSLNQDQQNIVLGSGEAYYEYFNAFGRDSYDAAGHEMQSVNNDPRINCPNANWNGLTTNYCNGVTADDVVAHEWGHAYTEYTHNLIYQWQSGALNESYSDIWGEVVDMLNGRGTDSPAPVRTVDVCSAYTTPVPELVVNSPASIAGSYLAMGAAFGPSVTTSGVTGNVVLADDGVAPGSDACTALVNAGAIAGNIAMVDRGSCTFTSKVKNAQNAGATAVIVANSAAGAFGTMGGSDPTITIPSVMITYSDGNLIKAELANTVNATVKAKGAGTPENSYRWLMGEDATAFGSAIRDMWAPTCKSDPGKVSDAEYQCSSSDGGGVHTNSGVPNHGFSLLVDGGTYNGHTVNAIGLVKAAHLYWRAESVYQTPTTDFPDHADSLQASCQDLIGVQLEGLSTSPTPAGLSGQSITSADCAAVDEMIAAVELRLNPATQCNFQPILQPNPPPLCTSGNANKVFTASFEEGLKGWTLFNQGVYSGWPGFDWVSTKQLPQGHKGQAAYATDPLSGDCGGGAGDNSGVMTMTSPRIKIPSGGSRVPRMAFDHYVATEANWDGGNVKISINGGAFNLVPASAFTFNPYNLTLQPPQAGNTNPLAGEPAFSGTNGGSLFGSWGQSQIDLAALGVRPGDTIQLRYDFGQDGCNGNDGWYVDDIQVYTCKP